MSSQHFYILNFHGIGVPGSTVPPSERRVWIEQPLFEQILDLAQVEKRFELTFDDANESDYAIALPALRSRGLKARFFIVADRLGRPGYLTCEQLRTLTDAGMTIGNHGLRHQPWAGLGRAGLHEELVLARERLEKIVGAAVPYASCPYGRYNRRVVRSLRAAGYSCLYTSDEGSATVGSFIQPRNSIYSDWTLARVLASCTEEPGFQGRVWRGVKLAFKRWR